MQPNPFDAPQSPWEQDQRPQHDFRMFSMDRIGRLRFITYSMGVGFASLIPAMLAGVALGIGENFDEGGGVFTAAIWLTYLFAIPASLAVTVRRFHDLGQSGWLTLLYVVPLVNMFIIIYLYFGSGDEHDNRFGPPPPPNSPGVFAAIGTVVLAFVGMFVSAGIAMDSYKERAKEIPALEAEP